MGKKKNDKNKTTTMSKKIVIRANSCAVGIVFIVLVTSPCRFTFKVVVEIEEAPAMTLECFGSPHSKKKIAAEHAAEGALWFLKREGYMP